MTKINWDESAELDKLAELSIKTGVALQPGQDLIITAPIEAAPLVRKLAHHAYKAGAGIVTPFYNDPEVVLARYKNADKTSFEKATDWLFDGMALAKIMKSYFTHSLCRPGYLCILVRL